MLTASCHVALFQQLALLPKQPPTLTDALALFALVDSFQQLTQQFFLQL